ncbi:SH2 domain-containing protein 4A [Gadus morhua]|uniref:SH2 domain containing 4B n=1 Tax=Gadus morhua TaxID=8049 RepID=A0A8C5AKI3_GADMO|nr:SH2 domain-containing protein 4A-like [Gadus morhua]
MLAKILELMWVEPEVLEALSEEQKRILFFKMREEQVRRWTEREGRGETEDNKDNHDHGGPKKASTKHVTWLLGRDGDVRVSVIGEEDEFRSSKLLQSLLNNRYHDACMVDVQPAASFPPRVTDLQGRRPGTAGALAKSRSLDQGLGSRSSVEERADASAPEDDSDCEPTAAAGGGDYLDRDGAPLRQPGLRNHGNRPPPLRAQSLDAGRTLDGEAPGGLEEEPEFGARVAESKRTSAPGTTVSSKPAVPVKPPHLQPGNRSVPRPVPEGITAS